MFDLLKIVAMLFIALGAGIALIKATPEGGAGAQFTLFQDLPAGGSASDPPQEKGPAGIVIEVLDGALLVLPWEDGGPVEVDATAEEIGRCPVGARVPDCL